MPLLRFDLVVGRTPDQLRTLLDAAHTAMVEAFAVPDSDRYQVVHQHAPGELVLHDTGLGIERTDDVVLLQVTSRPRGRAAKERFYALLVENLARDCGIKTSDVVVSVVESGDDDWSFGHGRAQFLTGEL
ncbi:tautomerase family protein [Kineococcus gynurae]|uniref:Tautomerase family protein n=1 Tax=Kineococcus gynurae TaxID=452979 RepID=A0ABV5LTP6_9ACTN